MEDNSSLPGSALTIEVAIMSPSQISYSVSLTALDVQSRYNVQVRTFGEEGPGEYSEEIVAYAPEKCCKSLAVCVCVHVCVCVCMCVCACVCHVQACLCMLRHSPHMLMKSSRLPDYSCPFSALTTEQDHHISRMPISMETVLEQV